MTQVKPVKAVIGLDEVNEDEEEEPMTVQDYIRILAAIADGLNMEDDYNKSLQCIYNYVELYLRFESGFEILFEDEFNLDEFYEILLATGNLSSNYKYCWNTAQESIKNITEWAS